MSTACGPAQAANCLKPISNVTALCLDKNDLEKIIFKSLAKAFPDLAKPLLLRMNNFIDISTLFINHHVMIPGMKGKYSLKHIINAIQDKTLYDELSIQSGFHAAHAYKHLYYQKNHD